MLLLCMKGTVLNMDEGVLHLRVMAQALDHETVNAKERQMLTIETDSDPGLMTNLA